MWEFLTNQPSFPYMYEIQGNYEELTQIFRSTSESLYVFMLDCTWILRLCPNTYMVAECALFLVGSGHIGQSHFASVHELMLIHIFICMHISINLIVQCFLHLPALVYIRVLHIKNDTSRGLISYKITPYVKSLPPMLFIFSILLL